MPRAASDHEDLQLADATRARREYVPWEHDACRRQLLVSSETRSMAPSLTSGGSAYAYPFADSVGLRTHLDTARRMGGRWRADVSAADEQLSRGVTARQGQRSLQRRRARGPQGGPVPGRLDPTDG